MTRSRFAAAIGRTGCNPYRPLLAPVTLAAAILVAMHTGCRGETASSGAATGQRPNIVFIMVDTLRADRLGAYGHPGGLSPFLDELAAEGVVFERAITPSPWTLPSIASLFSGFYPAVHQATDYRAATGRAPGGRVRQFDDQFETLAETLSALGYETAAMVANPFIIPEHGFAQGFDHFDRRFTSNTTPGQVINESALNWLRERGAGKPFFLYLHYMDTHAPYVSDDALTEPLVRAVAEMESHRYLTDTELSRWPGYFRKSGRPGDPLHQRLHRTAEYWNARYDACVRQMDVYLQSLRAELSALGLWRDAYVILTSDHGESLGEKNHWAHGTSPYEGEIHVPLILRWPDGLPDGRRIPQTVRLFDVYPTLLEQLGAPLPANLQAQSLIELIDGRSTASRVAMVEAINTQRHLRVVVEDPWKLYVHLDQRRHELYNLADDPLETNDLAAAHPERVKALRARLDAHLESSEILARSVQVREVEVSEAQRRRLAALGYAGDIYDDDEEENDDGDDDGP